MKGTHMAFTEQSELRDVNGISAENKSSIKAFMQGAVYSWIKNNENKPFAVRDLMGGENTDWTHTPLEMLYSKHINSGKDSDSAFTAAAIDLGWLVKSMLFEDKRIFKVGDAGRANSYYWVRD
jgi:hypothetical protein